jgi:lipopolysaccharide export system permease protein
VKQYQKYLLRQLVGPFLVITVGLTAVIWLTQSLRFVDLIVNKGLTLGLFLYLSLLLLPSFLSVILPIALFCALLFVLNRLVLDSELTPLRAAGLSHWALARPAFLLAGLIVLIVYSINLYFVPVSYRAFKERQFAIRSDYATAVLQEGVFNNLSDDLTVYVRSRSSDGTLHGILVHDVRAPNQPVTMMAESGALVSTAQGPRFLMLNGNRQEIDRTHGQLSLLYFDRYTLDLGQLKEAPEARWRESRERFLSELFNPGEGVDDQRNRGKFFAEAHQRLVSPLHAVALVAIALAALLAGQYNRRGHWRRIGAAILAGVALEALGLALTNITAKSTGLFPLMYLNVAIAVGGALFVLTRSRLPAHAAKAPAV